MSVARPLHFFLGGRDLEMAEIAAFLKQHRQKVQDKRLGWGAARASAYAPELATARRSGHVPVLVELQNDLNTQPWPLLSPGCPLPTKVPEDDVSLLLVDHHGAPTRQREPTSLEQVFFLVTGCWPLNEAGHATARARALGWNRRMDLVAANDRGHVAAMLELDPKPTADEMRQIRREDRAAQGLTEAEELAAPKAVAQRRTRAAGALTLVHAPTDRVAAVTDAMDSHLGGPGYQNLLVVSPSEFNFFGNPEAIELLQRSYPGGYRGARFWGRPRSGMPPDSLVRDLEIWASKLRASVQHRT